MKIYGLIVGIDRYEEPGFTTKGPCHNAVAIAEWLAGVTGPENIYVFLGRDARIAPCQDGLDERIAELRFRKMCIADTVDSTTIDEFCFSHLPKDRPVESRLLVFWSGHGYVGNDGSRLFLCPDFTSQQFKNRIFNGSMFLRHLRSPLFRSFAEVLMLADVCGVYSDVMLERGPRGDPESVGQSKQLAFFATPEGQFAYDEDGRGIFTSAALETLAEFKEWPDLETYQGRLTKRLDGGKQPAFCLEWFSEKHEARKIFGKLPATAVATEIILMLESAAVPLSAYTFHYRRTVDSLGNPNLNSVQGITGMVSALVALQDSPGGLSHGLLQFLVRVSQLPLLRQPVESWLQAHAQGHASKLEGIRRQLEAENNALILLVVVTNDVEGEIADYSFYLRTRNLHPVSHPPHVTKPFFDWDGFCRDLLDLLRELQSSIDQIHFLVDPPLFDRPFHKIFAPGGTTIGEEFVVFLRHRERLFSQKANLRRAWVQYADEVRAILPRDMKVLPLPDIAMPLIGHDRGICYFKEALPAALAHAPGSIAGKSMLARLLRLGVPYLCWLESAPPEVLQNFVSLIGGGLAGANSIHTLPEYLTQQRNNLNPLASDSALLWDDPEQNPFE